MSILSKGLVSLLASSLLFLNCPAGTAAGPSEMDAATWLQQLGLPAPQVNQLLLLDAIKRADRQSINKLVAAGAEVNDVSPWGITPLSTATQAGNSDIAALLLRHGAQPNLGDARGVTPLFIAIASKNPDLVSLLIKAGADVNTSTQDQDHPLLAAARTGHTGIVELLLDRGTDITAQNAQGESALWIAVENGDPKSTRALLKRGIATDGANIQGENLLTLAARRGDESLVQLLVNKGLPVNKPDRRGRLALAVALGNGNTPAVNALLAAGAEVGLLDHAGRAALDRYLETTKDVPAELTRKWVALTLKHRMRDRDGKTPLHEAAMKGASEMAAALVDSGTDVNPRDNRGATPLHWAAHNGHVSIIELLLQRGAKINVTDNSGYTPLNEATLHRQPHVVRTLLRNGADMEIAEKSGEGGTPLYLAIQKGHVEIAQLLLNAGANPNAASRFGRTPMHDLYPFKGAELAGMLLDHGAHIDHVDSNGQTALIHAVCDVQPVNKGLILLFLDRGANPRRVNNEGRSALGCAVAGGRADIVRALVTRGANVNHVRILGSKHQSILDLALEKGNTEIVSVLRTAGAKEGSQLPKPTTTQKTATPKMTAPASRPPLRTNPLQLDLKSYSATGQIENVQSLLSKGAKANSEALYAAARHGHPDIIRLLVRHGADVNAPDPFFKQTPLAGAIPFGRVEIVEALLALGADPNRAGGSQDGPCANETPLALAIRWTKPAVAEILLKHGANPNADPSGDAGRDGKTLLMEAVEKNDPILVGLLTRYRANPHSRDRFGATALHRAIARKNENIVRTLLTAGARVDVPNSRGVTPIDTAIETGQPKFLSLLLEKNPSVQPDALTAATTSALARDNAALVAELLRHGADPGARHPDSGTPLLLWVLPSARSPDTAKLLVDHGANLGLLREDGSSALLLALDRSFYDLAALMLRKGADPALTNDRDEYPLLRAAERGRFELIELMRERGTSLDYRDVRGRTVLMRLTEQGNVAGAMKLLELGASPDIASREGDTALILATRKSTPELVRHLATRGKNINQLGARGYSALHEAIGDGKRDFAIALLDSGADIEASTRDGLTPLMLAARENKVELIALLLERKANVHARSRYQASPHDHSFARYRGNGRTALMLASAAGAIHATQLLIGHGAPVNAQDDDGNTALMLAAYQKPELIRGLLSAGAEPSMRNKAGLSVADLAKMAGRNPDIVLRGTPDMKFASPEKTWQRYLTALRDGDKKAAVSCLISTARENVATYIDQASPEQLLKMAETIKTFRVSTLGGDHAEAIAIRRDGRAGMIYFQKIDGEWKIAEM